MAIQVNLEFYYHKEEPMKQYIIPFIFALLCFSSCSKDTGNYEYTDVNLMTVTDTAGESISAKNYDLMYGETLTLEMKATGTLPTFDPKQVQYNWILNEDTIAKGGAAKFNAENLRSGENQIILYAKDPTNGLDYMTAFKINLSASISKGFFILTADAANNTKTYFRSSLNPQSEPNLVEHFGIDQEITLGSHPIELKPIYVNRKYSGLYTYTAQGENVFYQFNLNTLSPVRTLSGAGNGLDGGNLVITSVKPIWNSETGEAFITENGQVRHLNQGFVKENAVNDPTFKYDFGKEDYVAADYNNSRGTLLMGFDHLSNRIMVLSYNGRIRNQFLKPNLDLATDELPGYSYVASGGNLIAGSNDYTFYMLVRNGSAVSCYQTSAVLNYEDNRYYPQKVELVSGGTIANIDKAVQPKYHRWTSAFYFAVGRTIYRMTPTSIIAREFITLPDDGTGDIVSWNFDDDTHRTLKNIGIATYNGASSQAKKGSLYHYSLINEGEGTRPSLTSKDLYKIDKAVSIGVAVQ